MAIQFSSSCRTLLHIFQLKVPAATPRLCVFLLLSLHVHCLLSLLLLCSCAPSLSACAWHLRGVGVFLAFPFSRLLPRFLSRFSFCSSSSCFPSSIRPLIPSSPRLFLLLLFLELLLPQRLQFLSMNSSSFVSSLFTIVYTLSRPSLVPRTTAACPFHRLKHVVCDSEGNHEKGNRIFA